MNISCILSILSICVFQGDYVNLMGRESEDYDEDENEGTLIGAVGAAPDGTVRGGGTVRAGGTVRGGGTVRAGGTVRGGDGLKVANTVRGETRNRIKLSSLVKQT